MTAVRDGARCRVLSPILSPLLLVLGGCGIIGPDLDTVNRRPLDPVPAEYATWYGEVETCLGVAGDFGAVTWLVADDVLVDGVRKAGVLEFPDRITMRRADTLNRIAVTHEMVHHITQVGDALHDTNIFLRCH